MSPDTSAFTRLVLPAPEGAEMTNRYPVGEVSSNEVPDDAAEESLNVLNLFSHLLD